MRFIDCLSVLCILGIIPATLLAQTQAQGASDEPIPEIAGIQDPIIKKIVETMAVKLAPLKGYTAEVESQALDPNGGFNKFIDDQTVRMPDHMLVKRKVLVAHNSSAVGQEVTMVVDGNWTYARIDASHTSYPGKPSYSKTNLKAVEKAGGPSVPEYISMLGNIIDPLRPYKLNTLKLAAETSTTWVLLAEYKQEGAPWKAKLTIEKKTGFLREIEAVIPEMGQPVILFKLKKIKLQDNIEDSLFAMEMPKKDDPEPSYVSDNTSTWIESLKAQRMGQK